MPPKNHSKHKPANINIGRARQPELTFNETSLQPFLRAYTRMDSRDRGGGDRQFMEEFNLARCIVEELNHWRYEPPERIHDLVYNIANPHPGQQPVYPTTRAQGVTDEEARQNRLIITILLMQHATNDRQHGRDGGISSGGLWLPPRSQALAAQETASTQQQPVRYPAWSRENAVASTPSLNANWSSSGQPPQQPLPANDLHHRASQGFDNQNLDSPVGRLAPFSSDYAPTQISSYGPLPAGLSGYGLPSYGPQQWPSRSNIRGEYGVPPPPPGFQPQPSLHDTRWNRLMLPAPVAASQGSGLGPYASGPSRGYDLSGRPFWQSDNRPINQGSRPAGSVPPPPGLVEAQNSSPFGSEANSPARSIQPPIGSDRPWQDSCSTRSTPTRPGPGRGGRNGCVSLKEDVQKW